MRQREKGAVEEELKQVLAFLTFFLIYPLTYIKIKQTLFSTG